ncbi:MAG: hypothetical protein B7Y40_04565, partial [Gammaproteobacteria bacterium 28-57-27]
SIIATVTDANGKTASASVAITVTATATASTLRVALTTASANLNTSEESILTALVTNADGSIASGKTVRFGFGSNLSGASLSATSAISAADGSAKIRYTAGAKSGTDTVIASVTDASGKTAESSVAITVTAVQAVVGSVRILSSNNTIGTNDAQGVDVIIEIKSASNVLMPNVPVTLTADQGSLLISSNTTDASGTITAKLTTSGLYSNGTITLNASAGGVNAQALTLSVTGTSVALSGQGAARAGDVVPYTLTLTDSGDKPIASQAVSLSTTSGTLSASSVITDFSGQATFTLTAAAAATITANVLNASNSIALAVADTSVTFTAPSGDFIAIDTPTAVSVEVKVGGVLAPNVSVDFASTRGTLTATSALTNANGIATVTVNSSTSGPAILSATFNGVVANKEATFTASTASKIVLQADPSVVSVNAATTLTAIVRDGNYNIVANKSVSFNIIKDSSNGKLSSTTAVTDADGRAQVIFTAGSTSTANNGVEIRAIADGISTSAFLTVGGESLFVRIGSDHLVVHETPNLRKTFSVLVTDSAGAPVEGATLSMRALPVYFHKGFWAKGSTSWVQNFYPVPPLSCTTEDTNGNGVLDPGEDTNGDGKLQTCPIPENGTFACYSEDVDQSGVLGGNNIDYNGNGLLDPGNVATFSSTSLVTDSTGFVRVDLIYPMSYGAWVTVTLSATAKVAGSEALAEATFVLPVLASLVNDLSGPAPSANPSPWGIMGMSGSTYGPSICTNTD